VSFVNLYCLLPGLEPYVKNPDERLVTVNTIKVQTYAPATLRLAYKTFCIEQQSDRRTFHNLTQIPDGVDFAAVIKNAMDVYNVEISGGLGPSIGKVWRVGIMVNPAHCDGSSV
jgi:alanine-glyoxylate transaminase / serine-glyoxylate transaminase / serine-pyruvate transaminase